MAIQLVIELQEMSSHLPQESTLIAQGGIGILHGHVQYLCSYSTSFFIVTVCFKIALKYFLSCYIGHEIFILGREPG